MIPVIYLAQMSGLLDSAKHTGEIFGFHWSLFLSNFISFFIVCFLLQKFAYKPVVTVLEARREKIAEGLRNAEKIKAELADAEKQKADILAQANAEAQRMIQEARASAAAAGERKTQEAIVEAEQIITKAHEAAQLEHDRMLADLKREVGRLVTSATTRVTGKILTNEDQERIDQETAGQLAA